MKLIIAEEYTKTPGARYIREGDFSGEDFRIRFLEPRFKEALEKDEKLHIDLDGGYGYPPSFLDEAFGGLALIYGADTVIANIELISYDEPRLLDEIVRYIHEAEGKSK